MIKPDSISVSLYMIDGKIKIFAQFGLPGMSIEQDSSGKMDDDKKKAFTKAMEEAISNWEIVNV